MSAVKQGAGCGHASRRWGLLVDHDLVEGFERLVGVLLGEFGERALRLCLELVWAIWLAASAALARSAASAGHVAIP